MKRRLSIVAVATAFAALSAGATLKPGRGGREALHFALHACGHARWFA